MLRFVVRASNNKFKYEAMIMGLEMARELEVDGIVVFSDYVGHQSDCWRVLSKREKNG